MIKIFDNSTQGGSAMPVSPTADAPAAAGRTLAVLGGVWAATAVAGAKRRSVDAAPVCGHTATTAGYVLAGAFPGTSSWSPPI